jgi:hypothetical protein
MQTRNIANRERENNEEGKGRQRDISALYQKAGS